MNPCARDAGAAASSSAKVIATKKLRRVDIAPDSRRIKGRAKAAVVQTAQFAT
jgi:hypothetical protein